MQKRSVVLFHFNFLSGFRANLFHVRISLQETRGCGGLEALTPLLRETNPRFLALLTDSLYLLLLDNPQSKLSFLSLSGPSLLINLLDTHRQYPKLVYTVVRCIRVLSVCPQNKTALISLGEFYQRIL